MPPAPPQGGQNESAALGPIWIVATICIAGLAIWYFGHAYVVYVYFHLKLIEIGIFQFFSSGLNEIKEFILQSSPENITFTQMGGVARQVGNYIRYPIVPILLLLALVLNSKAESAKYHNVYSMKTLLNSQVSCWPQLTPVLKLDLIQQNINDGPWAMAMQPMYFAKYYKLLLIEMPKRQEGQLSKEVTYKVSVIQSRAKRLFIMQLGKRWKGFDNLPIHVKALFAIFAAKASRSGEEAKNFLYKLSASSKEGMVDFSGAGELLKKYKDSSVVTAVVDKHAYVLTVMASLLEAARLDGVLSCADFLWLKPIDRCLWFLLNCVGRQTAFVEVAGPFAHWIAEKELGHKICSPMVDQAVKALDLAIKEVKFNPEKQE